MKSSFADIPIVLTGGDKPLFIELFEILRDAILDGRLEGGQVLPSTRDLARKLGVSRHTILKSTKLLVTQGYLDSSDQMLKVFPVERTMAESAESQSEICHAGSDEHDCSPPVEPATSIFARKLLASENSFLFPEINFAPKEDDATPLEQWRRILLAHAKECVDEQDADPLGYEPLREAVSKYVNRFRSLKCKAENVVIFSGPTAALDFIARLTIDRGDSVLMENPGFKHARELFTTCGAIVDTVGVDSEGIIMRQLQMHSEQAKFLYVTPAHQNPTGATMSVARRKELLEWSVRTGTTIIEDGYDSEYWHRRTRPAPALQGLDRHGSVIYLASFWRVLLPVTRISFAVFPDQWLPLVRKLKALLERDVNVLDQKTLAEFIERGLYERALRKNQRVLSYRRQSLVIALMRHLGQKISIAKEDSGTNLVVTFSAELSEDDIEEAAYKANLPLISTSSYYTKNAVAREFLLPFSNLDDEKLEDTVTSFATNLLAYKIVLKTDNNWIAAPMPGTTVV